MTAPSARAPATGTGPTSLLDCRPLAAAIRHDVATRLQASRTVPGLSVVLVGDDAASGVYAASIVRSAADVGASAGIVRVSASAGVAGVRDRLEALCADSGLAGVILQLPLPADIALADVRTAIDPAKDLDGIHPWNAGRVAQGDEAYTPSCAEAALEILHWIDAPIAGRRAVVVGRSNVVGKPAALLLVREHATVTVCHRRTRDLVAELRTADIIVVAAGSPGLVRGGMVAPGAIVIDCGINVVDGHVIGDVELASVAPVASVVTVTPGGVGPVTSAVLLRHLAHAAGA